MHLADLLLPSYVFSLSSVPLPSLVDEVLVILVLYLVYLPPCSLLPVLRCIRPGRPTARNKGLQDPDLFKVYISSTGLELRVRLIYAYFKHFFVLVKVI